MQDLAKHKFAPADYIVGIWELEGDVLPKDVAAGLAEIQKAADKNYGPAALLYRKFRLGKLLIDAPEHSEQDWLQGVAWLQLAQGHELAAASP